MSELHQDDFMIIENQEQHVLEVENTREKKEMEKCHDDIQDVVQGNDNDDDDNKPLSPDAIQNCSESDSMIQQQQQQQQQSQQQQDQQQQEEEEVKEEEEEKDQQENQEVINTMEPQTVTTLLDSEKENQLSTSSSSPTDVFVNYGFLRWNQARDEWLSLDKNNNHDPPNNNIISSNSATLKNHNDDNGQNRRHRTTTTGGAIPIDVDDVLDGLFHPRWRTTGGSGGGGNATMNLEDMPLPCFARPVPLPQMIDILMDLWEAEGLDI